MAHKTQSPTSKPATLEPGERMISSFEFRNLLGIHEKTLHRWIQAGRVPAPIRLGTKRLKWPWSVVRKFLDEIQRSGKLPA